MGRFFKICPKMIWATIGSNLWKFKLEKSGEFAQNLAKMDRLVYEWVIFSSKNWYLHGSTFKFHGSISLPKPNLSYPPPLKPDGNVRNSNNYNNILQFANLYHVKKVERYQTRISNWCMISCCWGVFFPGSMFEHITDIWWKTLQICGGKFIQISDQLGFSLSLLDVQIIGWMIPGSCIFPVINPDPVAQIIIIIHY